MAKRSNAKSPLVGHWRITWMEQWDQAVVDAEVEGFFQFKPNGSGQFQFAHVTGDIDYKEGIRDGKLSIDFSWNGNDEMDPAHGRGWAVLNDDEIDGMIFIHHGDQSAFKAKRKRQ